MPTITSTEFTNPNVLQTLKNPPTSLMKKKKLEKAYTGLLVCHLKKEEKTTKKILLRDSGETKLCLRVSRKGPLRVLPQSSQLFSSQKARESHPAYSLPPRQPAARVNGQ